MANVAVPLDQLTDRQLHLYLVSLLQRQETTLDRLDYFMSDLNTSVSALQAAVDNMAVRFASQNQVLTDALGEATSALDALQDVSDADKQALTDALANAQAAADSINSDVAELNGIGAAPDVPVEPVPVEELPAPPSETPTEETPPAETV